MHIIGIVETIISEYFIDSASPWISSALSASEVSEAAAWGGDEDIPQDNLKGIQLVAAEIKEGVKIAVPMHRRVKHHQHRQDRFGKRDDD